MAAGVRSFLARWLGGANAGVAVAPTILPFIRVVVPLYFTHEYLAPLDTAVAVDSYDTRIAVPEHFTRDKIPPYKAGGDVP